MHLDEICLADRIYMESLDLYKCYLIFFYDGKVFDKESIFYWYRQVGRKEPHGNGMNSLENNKTNSPRLQKAHFAEPGTKARKTSSGANRPWETSGNKGQRRNFKEDHRPLPTLPPWQPPKQQTYQGRSPSWGSSGKTPPKSTWTGKCSAHVLPKPCAVCVHVSWPSTRGLELVLPAAPLWRCGLGFSRTLEKPAFWGVHSFLSFPLLPLPQKSL